MIFQTAYRPATEQDAQDFVEQQTHLNLITWSEDDCQVGLFNPIKLEGSYYLHLNRSDPQIAQMRASGKAKIVFQEIAAVLPSYWTDARDGSMATMCYRYVEMHCEAHFIETVEEMMPLLAKMLAHYQPEGGYDPMTMTHEQYVKVTKRLCVIKLTPIKQRNKWKMVQNKPKDRRCNIIKELEKRNLPGDAIAATEIAKTLSPDQPG